MDEQRPVSQEELKKTPLSKEDAYFQSLEEERQKMAALKQKARLCPVDGATLAEETRHGVVIDVCPTCHGVWLDTHEFDLLAQALLAAKDSLKDHHADSGWHRFIRNLLPYQK